MACDMVRMRLLLLGMAFLLNVTEPDRF
jgi:hypothetical protein